MEKSKMPKFDKNLFGSFVLNETVLLVITCVILFGLKLRFGNGDEYGIAFSMAGGFGYDPSHLIYATIGPLFGAFETVLSFIIRNGSVYMVTLVALALLSASNFYLALKHFDAQWYGFIINWGIYAYMLLNLNYTIITIMLSGSALLWCLAPKDSFSGKKSIGLAWAAVLTALLFAASLRNSLCIFVFLCVLAFAFPYSDKKQIKPLFLSGLFILLTIGANYLVRLIICSSSKVSGDYLTWYDRSVGFRDFPDVDYDRYRDLFEAVGWSSNDVDLLNHWGFDDLQVFTTQKMSYVLDNIPLNQHYNLSVKYIIKDMLESDVIRIAAVLTLLAIICTIGREKKFDIIKIIRAVLIMAPFGVIMVGLSVRQRVYAHVYMPFLLLIILELVIFVRKENKMRFAFALAVLALLVNWNISGVREQQAAAQRSEVYGEYIGQHMGDTFLVDNSAISAMTEYALPIVSDSRYELFPNLITMTDFDTASPRDFIKLSDAGIRDTKRPYLGLLQENVYYIGREDGAQLGYLRTYFKEHFDYEVTIETVHDFNMDTNIRVYKFR